MPRTKKATAKLTTAIGYIRVSTDEQSIGVEVQRSRIEAYCVSRGWQLLKIYEDVGASGKTLDRLGMNKVLKVMASRQVGAVVTLKLDRFTRSVSDLNALLKESGRSGVALVSIMETLDTSSAGGRLMLNVLAVIAEWEREVIAERTSQALTLKSARGERVGRYAKFGNTYGEGARAENEKRMLEEVRKILSSDNCDEDEGGISLRCIAQQLEAQGFLNRKGNRYSASSVWRIVQMIEAEQEANPTESTLQSRNKIERTRELYRIKDEERGRLFIQELEGGEICQQSKN